VNITYTQFKAKYAAYFNHPSMQGQDYYRCAHCNDLMLTICTDSAPGEIERLDTEFGTEYFQQDDIRVCPTCSSELETEVVPDANEIYEIEQFIARHTVSA